MSISATPLGEQPIGQAVDLDWTVSSTAEGKRSVRLTWGKDGTEPEDWEVYSNGANLGRLDGSRREVTVTDIDSEVETAFSLVGVSGEVRGPASVAVVPPLLSWGQQAGLESSAPEWSTELDSVAFGHSMILRWADSSGSGPYEIQRRQARKQGGFSSWRKIAFRGDGAGAGARVFSPPPGVTACFRVRRAPPRVRRPVSGRVPGVLLARLTT